MYPLADARIVASGGNDVKAGVGGRQLEIDRPYIEGSSILDSHASYASAFLLDSSNRFNAK